MKIVRPRKVRDSVAHFAVTPREQELILLKRRIVAPVRRGVAMLKARGAGRDATGGGVTGGAGNGVVGNAARPVGLEVVVREFSYYRGRLHVDGSAASGEPIVGIGVSVANGGFQQVVELAGQGERVTSFTFEVAVGDHQIAAQTTLAFRYASGRVDSVDDIAGRALSGDPVAELTQRFREQVAALPQPRVLEVGSRARSGNTYRSWLPSEATYVGCDILPGENVDVVGDAHRLSDALPGSGFDALFSVSTMEHLAMPWLAAAEMNRVLKVGGLMFHATHQTWPVHDAPWDFYRFSEYAWVTLFNRFSGFEIIETAAGEPGKVVANVLHPATNGLELQPAYLGSAVLARKVGETDLDWAADAAAVVQDAYPQ